MDGKSTGTYEVDSELWSWKSDDPEGICLALPRWHTELDTAQVFGIICFGYIARTACFFDNTDGVLERGEPQSIESFLGGAELVGGAGGVCTSCHAGENPFVVHPAQVAFGDLVDNEHLRSFGGWYQPLVADDPSWPQNPGPLSLPQPPANEAACNDCHLTGRIAGGFPNVADPRLQPYCDNVLWEALYGPDQTMPLGYPGWSFDAQINTLLELCGYAGPAGTLESGVPPSDDTDFVSPPSMMPMYTCSEVVGVRNARPGATVEVIADNTPLGTWSTQVSAGVSSEVHISLPFENDPGITWTTRQEYLGIWSEFSEPVSPIDHTDLYSGVDAPEISPRPYECSETIAVMHIPGARLFVDVNGEFEVNGGPSGYSVVQLPDPLLDTDQITVRQSICGDDGPSSPPHDVQAEPEPLQVATFGPTEVYEGQQAVGIANIVPGSSQHLSSSLAGSIATFASWPWHARLVDVGSPLGRPLEVLETVTVRQTLCEPLSNPVSTFARACATLPAAQIAPPREGDTTIQQVGQTLPGEVLRVYNESSEEEIGDSGAPSVNLREPLMAGDVLSIARQVGTCIASEYYQYTVGI